MKNFLFYILIALSAYAKAQCAPNWLTNSKSDSRTKFSDICTDSQNNIIVAGDFDSGNFKYQSITYTASCITELVTMKFDPSNSITWSKRFNTTGSYSLGTESYITSITTDNSNNVYLVGYFKGELIFGSYTLTASGLYDAFVVKLNGTNGNTIWAKRYSNVTGQVQFNNITYASSAIYVTGKFDGTCAFGTFSLTSAGSGDISVLKLDTAGTVLKAVRFGGSTDESGVSIKILAGGDLILGASYSSNFSMGLQALTNAGYNDVLISRINKTTFVPKWTKSGGSSFDDWAADVETDASANIYGLFTFSQSMMLGTQTQTVVGDKDVGYCKIDSSGNVAWFKSFGGPNTEYAGKIRRSNTSLIIAASCWDSIRFPGNINLNNIDKGVHLPILSRLDMNGNHLGHLLGNDTNSTPSVYFYSGFHGLAIDNNQNVYWTGEFLNKLNFLNLNTSLPANNNQESNAFILKVCETSIGIKENSPGIFQKALYPNPCSQKCWIEYSENIKTISIFNDLGQLVKTRTAINETKIEIESQYLPTGIYIVECVSVSGKVDRQKLVVQ